MAVRTATAPKPAQKVQRELEDLQLVLKARNGSQQALDALLRRYTGFVRLKASSYFLAGGDGDDLVQEGMIGLYKAVRDFRPDKETSFRSFAELCVTRQIITAIKTATRFKHAPLNTYVSFSHTPAGQESEGDCTLGLLSRHRALVARVAGAHALPRGQLLRGHGGRARLRYEDDRQRAPAREAQDPRAPEDARSAGLTS
jgi:RNA polymerase sigma factor (sigma-70 family)